MYQTALLLISGPIRILTESIAHYLRLAQKRVSKRLYIKFEPELLNPFTKSDVSSLSCLSDSVAVVYNNASSICKSMDVRLLLGDSKNSIACGENLLPIDAVITNVRDWQDVQSYLSGYLENSSIEVIKIDDIANLKTKAVDKNKAVDFDVFRNVCLGGTFDRLHNGHKVLLSEGILRATNKLIVGVSDTAMIKRKVLWELIKPVEERISEIENFLREVDPSLIYEVVPISDPYGPTITEPNIDCIVVTTETKVGGEKVNIEREKKGMKNLHMLVVDLVENTNRSAEEEEKLSSSTQRMHLLGLPLKKHTNWQTESSCHIVLKGHFLSDKRAVSCAFQALGLPVLSCDDILETIIRKDQQLIDEFMKLFLDEQDFEFDKVVIACLMKKEANDWLSERTCSKVNSTLKQLLDVYSEQETSTVLVSGSSIFDTYEVGFQEIWAAILPPSDVSKKLQEEFSLSEEESNTILSHLPSNEEYVKMANVVFCKKWSDENFKQQIERAWNYLKPVRESSKI